MKAGTSRQELETESLHRHELAIKVFTDMN